MTNKEGVTFMTLAMAVFDLVNFPNFGIVTN